MTKAILLPAAIVLALCTASAQTPGEAQGTRSERLHADSEDSFKLTVDVDLVLFNVTVFDHKNRVVSGLGRENFRLYEEGQLQDVNFFRAEDSPATIGLVIDNSASMSRKRDRVLSAAMTFTDASNPQDELFIVGFNERATLALPRSMSFTSDIDQLHRALVGTRMMGRTALYDAIAMALDHLELGRQQRKALVVLSDGADNASAVTLDNLLKRIQQSNASVFTIGIYDSNDNNKNPGVLKKIAKAGGTEAYFPDDLDELSEVWSKIAGGIRSQYTLGFTSRNPPRMDEYRRVSIVATGKDGKVLRVRARDGYRARGAVVP